MLNGAPGSGVASRSGYLDASAAIEARETRAADSHWLTKLLCLAVVLTGVLVLIGRWLDDVRLTSFFGAGASGKVNASVAFGALAVALFLRVSEGSRSARLGGSIARLLAIVSLFVAIITVLENVSSVGLLIDDLGIFGRELSAASGPFSFQTGLGIAAGALAILTVGRRIRGVMATEVLGLVGGAIGSISLLGYLYGASAFISLGGRSAISLPSALQLMCLSSAIVASDKDHALVRLLEDPGTTGQVMRRFIPAALLVVPVGAWVRLLGEQAHLYDEAMGLTLMVAFQAFLLVIIGAWTASRAGQLDESRRRAENDLIRLGLMEATPLIETAPVGLAVVDADLRCLYVNPSLVSAMGRSVSSSLGRRIDLVVPALDEYAVTSLQTAVRTGIEVRGLEVSGPPAEDGRASTWLVSARPLSAPQESNVGLALIVVDITERKRREQALASIAEMRRQTMAVDESIPFGVWIAGPDGKMGYLSRSFLALIGRSMDEAADFGWIDALVPETGPKVRAMIAAAVAGEAPWNFELEVIGADGQRCTILSRGLPVTDEAGAVSSWAGINLDITDRKQRDQFRDAFVGIVSHELRTPITSIYGAASLLNRAGMSDEQRSELLSDISEESERLRRLTEDLVVLAKAEHGTIQVHDEPVLLQHLLRRICDQEQARWPDRKFKLTLEAALPVASGEADFVEQILRNLLANAAKYGGPDSVIDVVADAPAGSPRVRVLDRGPGVDPAEADRLFEVFYRSERTSRISGSGIGLFVAQQLVNSIGGTIWAKPRDDGPGAEFGIQLEPLPVDPV